QRLFESDAACALARGAVALVERRFVNEGDAGLGGDLLQRRRHLQRMRAAFERAWTGDQRQRQIVAEARAADGDSAVGALIQTFIPRAARPWMAKSLGSTAHLEDQNRTHRIIAADNSEVSGFEPGNAGLFGQTLQPASIVNGKTQRRQPCST